MSIEHHSAEPHPGVSHLLDVVARLRHPEQGCPWDLKQTHATLKRYLLEEAYETLEAIDAHTAGASVDALREELGDVLLQVALHSQIAQDNGHFDFDAVCQTLAEKLIRRHPHVFAEAEVDTAEGVTAQWAEIKAQEKAASGQPVAAESILDGVSLAQPALKRAADASGRAVKVGFAWPDAESHWACVLAEFDELRAELQQPTPDLDRVEDELGDCLFATVTLAQVNGIDPEVALTRATDKFIRRFRAMEAQAERPLKELDFDAWDALWRAAKAATAPQNTPG